MNQFNEPWEPFEYGSIDVLCRWFAGGVGFADQETCERVSAAMNALAGVPTEDIEDVVKLGKLILLHRASLTMPMPEGFAERILGMRLGGIEDLLTPAGSPDDSE